MPTNHFTENQIREAAKNSSSLAEMCRQLGLIPAGGNYASMKRRIARYDIDISHFTGQSWRKGTFSDTPNTKIGFKKNLFVKEVINANDASILHGLTYRSL